MGTISVSLPSDGDTIDASDVNNPINTIVAVINGGIDADNIEAGGVVPNALVSGTGTSWVWQSWTPTVANITTGNGTTVAKYIQIGKTVFYKYTFTLGSTSAVGTDPTFTLPVTAATGTFLDPLGRGTMTDASSSNYYACSVHYSSTTVARLQREDASSTSTTLGGITATAPMTWATGDIISVSGTYEAA